MFLLKYLDQVRQDVQSGGRRSQSAPMTSRTRKRALTLPLQPSTTTKQKTSSQSQSALFTKLPEEIRLQICEACIGCRTIELQTIDKRLRQGGKSRSKFNTVPETHSLLPLLLTCRTIYSAAVTILYSTNTFITSEPQCVTHLSHHLLPHRFSAVRSLELNWFLMNTPHHISVADKKKFRPYEREWYDVWESLASMPGLRRLKVKLITRTTPGAKWRRDETKVLQPVAKVTRPEDFELVLPWPADESDEPALQKLPCRISRYEFVL